MLILFFFSCFHEFYSYKCRRVCCRKIYIDKKTYDRVGACYRYRFPDRYEIHLSEDTLKAKENEIKNIIAHEVLHTHFLTSEHNAIWKMYCNLMRNNLGYNIQIKYSWHKILK